MEVLTADQKTAVWNEYHDSIDYSRVKIYTGEYFLFQPDSVVITPDGNIYWPGGCGNGCSTQTLIHELMHVLQYQRGVNVLAAGLMLHTAKYLTLALYDPYLYASGTPFRSLNIEQQAEYARFDYCNRAGLICSPSP